MHACYTEAGRARFMRDEEPVFGVSLGGEQPKAYPLDALLAAGVVNDRLSGVELVLVADAASGTVRANRRGDTPLRPGWRAGEPAAHLVDERGGVWRLTEEVLEPFGATGGDPLPRVPGHVAFWFG